MALPGVRGAMTLRLAVFDLDGTLIDSASSIVEGITACWQACGFPDARSGTGAARDRPALGRSMQVLLPGSGERELGVVRAYYDDVMAGRRAPPPRREPPFPAPAKRSRNSPTRARCSPSSPAAATIACTTSLRLRHRGPLPDREDGRSRPRASPTRSCSCGRWTKRVVTRPDKR